MRPSSACKPIRAALLKGDPRGRPSHFGAGLFCLTLWLAAACGPAGPVGPGSARGPEPGTSATTSPLPHAGPVVLVTYSNLRSDAIGYLGGPTRTPHFDGLARRAEFAGSAVAPSTSPPVSAASLILGTRPWQHQLLSHSESTLRDDLPTLGAALGEQGYHSVIHYPVRQLMHTWGFFRGFDEAADTGAGLDGVLDELRHLDGGRRLVWIHLRSMDLPWTDRRGKGSHGGKDTLGLADLYPYADPELAMPGTLRDRARHLYVDAVGGADRALGRILEALEASGHRNETLLAVTALHGLELGEHGQALYGHNLGRESIQVPLLVDLPGAWSTVPLGAYDPSVDAVWRPPVELIRLWPTLVQATGGRRLPLHPPSLFEPAAGPALSALYLANGAHLHSAVFAGNGPDSPPEQILVESRFAPPESQYYLALLAQASLQAPGLTESPRGLFDRLRRAALDAPPWSTIDPNSGEPTVSWRLERWRHVRGTDDVTDDGGDDRDDGNGEEARRRAGEAYAAWSHWVGLEETLRTAR